MDAMTTLAARMAALACELEVTPGHGGHYDGIMHAVDRIRAELAAAGPQTVWAVHADEYEDNGVRAILATPELAEQHRVQLDKRQEYTDFDVEEYDVLDQLPRLLKIHDRRVRVFPDGTVRNISSGKREEWDYLLGDHVRVQRDQYSTDVSVSDENPEPLLREQVEAALAVYATEGQWTADRLREITGQSWVSNEPVRVEQSCYDAGWGRVHYKASCRCPR